jgi:hypothetical protein
MLRDLTGYGDLYNDALRLTGITNADMKHVAAGDSSAAENAKINQQCAKQRRMALRDMIVFWTIGLLQHETALAKRPKKRGWFFLITCLAVLITLNSRIKERNISD